MILQRIRRFALLGALALGLSLRAGSAALADPVGILSLQTGHSIILNAEGLSRVAVGDGRIAGVVPIGTSQLIVNGKTSGHTTLFVWADGRRSAYEITVTDQSLDDIARLLRSMIGDANVQVVSFGNAVIVKGQVADAGRYEALNEQLNKFGKVSGTGGVVQIINAVTVSRPLGDIQDELSAIAGAHDLRADLDGKGDIVLSGFVHDRSEAERVLDRVRGLAGPFLSSDGKVIDRLGTEASSQIDVKVYVLEVDKTGSSELGIRLQSATVTGTSTQGGLNSANFMVNTVPSFVAVENPATSQNFGHALNIGNFGRLNLLAPTLDLMVQEGHAHILSSPDLMTLPGQEATFLVGGELPIPVSNGLGSVSISYKDFGVNLRVTPTILGNGGIDTTIAPEISDLDNADGVSINGFVVPALKVSRVSTRVITQSGESIVMAGLLRRVEQRTVNKIPLLGDLPILGRLFRSLQYQKTDTDVVFVMTPTLVTR